MNFTELNNKYGHAVYIPVTKAERPTRELTQIVNETRVRLQETLEAVSGITNLRRLAAGTFRSPMARKYGGRLVVLVGYGKRNVALHAENLPKRYFTTAEEAAVYLSEVLGMLEEGQLDEMLATRLNELKAAAKHARSFKKSPKGEHVSYNRATVVQEIRNVVSEVPLLQKWRELADAA